MRVGILSDTHVPDAYVHPYVLETLEERGVELILHAGDITSLEFLTRLREIAPVKAVRGNADRMSLPDELVVEVEGLKVGLIHGHRLPLDSQSLTYKALDMGVELLVFGHTHRFFYGEFEFHGEKVKLLNPGSPTLPRRSDPTFGVAEIDKGKFSFEVFKPYRTGWDWP
ncbi:metallophosphoesterase family protein [Palaeococcus ferrophilus]|uniref:metallophosphoesterase family protein n=1 Tax=Palaeococcus ferrophilus TaxID=83868 RepID=UPI00064FF534|nr:metallophosphoesterase [Palaeococcus ferrophilus]